MINLYDSKETDFSKNGIVILNECLSCNIIEELNGQYELELEYPLDSKGKWQYLLENNIIKADGQLFRIYRKIKVLNSIKVNAKHIFYDLADNFLEDVRPTNLNGAGALDWILDRTQYTHNFTSISDISKTGTAYYIRKNVVEALIGNLDNSFLTLWGGEIVRDNFTISILQARGLDRGVLVSYGKNILGIEETLDIDGICTRLMPIGKDGLLLSEKYIDSPYINNFPHPKIKIQEFTDIEDEGILRTTAESYMLNNKIDIPQFNYKIDFLELSKTEEYKNYAILERVYLGDTVTIKHSKLNINLKAKVIKVNKKILMNGTIKIESIELGNFKPNLGSSINKSIQGVRQEIVQVTSDYQLAIDNATKLITGSKGGNVVIRQDESGHPYEILIMDTTDVNTAQDVWRWNMGGFGHSSSGINGPYDTAITQDGSIVANFITTGILNAALVKTGLLKSNNNLTYINMDNGTFNFANRLIFDGTTMSLTGDFATYDADTGNKAIEIEKRILRLYDWDSNNECARMFSGKIIGQEEKKGTTLVARNGRYLTLSYEDGSGLFQPAMLLDAGAFGTNGKIDLYDASIQSGEEIWIQNLYVSGTKNSNQETKTYGNRLINAYETAEYFFGDIGSGKIGSNGECCVYIDEIFQECVNTNIEYHIFTQIYNGVISKIERYPNYFIVYGAQGTEFSWELKAKRKGFEHARLEQKYVGQNANIEDELNFKELSTDIEEELYIELSKELLEVE